MWDSGLFKAICSSDVGSDDGAAMAQRGRKVRVMPLHRTPFFFLFFEALTAARSYWRVEVEVFLSYHGR